MKKTKCVLYNQDTVITCNSLTEAGEIANTSEANFSAALRVGRRKIMDWNLLDMESAATFLMKYDELTFIPKLRVNGLLTPNKTEREYYRYQERKNACVKHINTQNTTW